MESREFRRIVDDILKQVIEANNIGVLRTLEKNLKEYLSYITEKIQEEENTESREILLSEKKEISELHYIIKTYLKEHDLRSGRQSIEEKEEPIHTSLYIGIVRRPIPKFRGSDNKIYGPFKVGDIILIGEKDFNKLRDRGLITEKEMRK